MYGFESLNKNLNPSKKNNTNKTNTPLIGKVVDIIYDETHPDFNKLGGYDSIGMIKFSNFTSRYSTEGITYYAKRFNSNIKKLPVKNEIVYIFPLNVSVDNTKVVIDYYYLDTINVLNTNHLNILPSTSYLNRYNESSNVEESENTSSVKSYPGDIIFEGRWNHGFILGHTKYNPSFTTTKKNHFFGLFNNNYKINNPIAGYNNDLNEQDSSLILLLQDKLNIDLNVPFYSTKQKTIPINEYDKNQIFLKSNRVVFLSDIDEIILYSKNNLYLGSEKDIILETTEDITLQSNKIYLGSKNADQPVMYGKKTNELLISLTSQLITLTDSLSKVVSTQPGTPLGSINIISKETNLMLNELNKVLKEESLLSKKIFL